MRRNRTNSTLPGPRSARFAAALGLLAFVSAWPAPAAGQAQLGSYVATAAASGVSMNYRVAGFIAVEEFVDGGGPVSQSQLNPNGASSFASLPYPGSTVIAYQGVLALAGVPPPPIAYPLYVAATDPGTPSASASDASGLYSIDAVAEKGLTTARARAGQTEQAQGSGSETVTSVKVDGDAITVVAQTLTAGLSAAEGLIRATTIRSMSTTTYKAGDKAPITKTDLAIDGLTLAGVPVSLTPAGLQIATGLVPTPAEDVNAQLAGLLEPSGMTVKVLSEQPVSGGARAPVFRMTAVVPETPALPGVGSVPPGAYTFEIGGATTSLIVGDAIADIPGSAAGDFTPSVAASPLTQSPADTATPAPVLAEPQDGTRDVALLPARLGRFARPIELNGLRMFYGIAALGAALAAVGTWLWLRQGEARAWTRL